MVKKHKGDDCLVRNVFYSFQYQNDISRVMVVRNRWVTYGGQKISGIIDHAEFEKVKQQGDNAIKNWIQSQLNGTSVTVVLVGADTLRREYVQYEICESIKRGNAIIGVYINRVRDLAGMISPRCPMHTIIGYYDNGKPAYFDEVADGIYDYIDDDGYKNLDAWVEKALNNH